MPKQTRYGTVKETYIRRKIWTTSQPAANLPSGSRMYFGSGSLAKKLVVWLS